MRLTLAVVILNYNTADLLGKYLPSVVEYSGQAEIVFVDNCSTDHSVRYVEENYPQIRIIKLDRNYGFTGGYNKALQHVKADCYCLLNSDVEVTPGWTEPLLRMMQDDDSIAACQPKLLSYCEKNKFEYAGAAGGYMDYLGYPFCAGRVFNNIEEDRGQYNEPREVFWASGAALVVRSELFHRFGGLDERFFAHMEEIDLCWRLKNAGYKICYNPESVVYHLGGGTLNKTSSRKTYLNFRNNLLLLHKNLPEKEKTKVFLVRAFLDFIAATVFLLQFKPSETKAVWTAHKDFRKMKKLYYGQISTIGEYPSCVCFRSIVFAAWISGKKCFNQLLDYIK